MRFVRVFIVLILLSTFAMVLGQGSLNWSPKELASIRQLWIGSLGQEPADPTNAVASDPRAATLGHQLFFDKNLSEDGSVACATCHDPEIAFADNNELAEGRGQAPRNTPSIIGSAFNRFQFWDGRADSLWSQALGPMESTVEHGTNRIYVAKLVFKNYRSKYEALFGKMVDLSDESRFPNLSQSLENSAVRVAWDNMRTNDQQTVLRIFTNVGKSIAAYERLLRPAAAPFDQFANSILETSDDDGSNKYGSNNNDSNAISVNAQAGLKLFIGKGNCVACHNSALFNDTNFYNTGVPINQNAGGADPGRSGGLTQLERSGFSCFSVFSDAINQCDVTRKALGLAVNALPLPANGSENTALIQSPMVSSSNSPDDVVEVSTTTSRFSEWLGAFKTPSLRNVAQTAPYMYAGQFKTLKQVIDHYSRAPTSVLGKTQIKPLELTPLEADQLVEFLKTLNSEVDANAQWLKPPR
jgi:cytochrome c peroxidase